MLSSSVVLRLSDSLRRGLTVHSRAICLAQVCQASRHEAPMTPTSAGAAGAAAGQFDDDDDDSDHLSRRDYRFIFPEFLPDPKVEWRNSVREKLERKDMLDRREAIEIPEFYVGSSMAVTVTDENSPHPNKTSRFVGLCIDRGGTGLRAWFILRNVLEGQGVEIMYQMYNPTIIKIEVLKLEKRLDDELYYLRDAPAEYSTIPFDMEAQILPEGNRVPVNKTVVPLNMQPWTQKWERYTELLQGYTLSGSDAFSTQCKVRSQMRWMSEGNQGWQLQTMKYDLMREYRQTINMEEQDKIWSEVGEKLEVRDKQMRRVAAKRAFVRPKKRM